jgi:hypothetical protein
MPLTVFDAVGKFSADTSDLDQFIVKLEQGLSNASEKAAAATQALKAAQDEFRTSIRAVSAAGGDTTENLTKLADAEKNLTLAAEASRREHASLKKELTDTGSAGKQMEYSFREARGSIALVGEQLGVHIPRELSMLLAHIPLVGAAFSAMLPLVGVVAAIGIIASLIEKHEKLVEAQRHATEASESLQIKQADLALGLHAANLQLEDQIAKLEGRPETNKLQIAMIAVKKAVDELATTYATDFSKMDAELEKQQGIWQQLEDDAKGMLAELFPEAVFAGLIKDQQEQVAGNYAIQESLKQVIGWQEKLNIARRKLADIDPAKDLDSWKTAAGVVATLAGNVQSAADAAHAAVKKVKPDATELLAALTDKAITARGEWSAMAEKLKSVGLEIKKVHQEMANDAAERAAKLAEQALSKQIEDIKTWEEAQRRASQTAAHGAAMWAVAQIQAADAAAIAHEDYLRRLVQIYTKAGDAEKEQEAQAKLDVLVKTNQNAALKALDEEIQKHQQAMRKVRDEYNNLIAANVDKEWEKTQRAVEGLTHAEEELSKVETKAAETQLAAKYRDQESAIQKLAQMRLITEQQMYDRLTLLARQQANDEEEILEKQLAKQQADLQTAQAKLAAEKNSPFVSQAQIVETETNLTKIKAAVVATQSQITQAEDRYRKQTEADDKSHYGRALNLATAYGNELLAEQLRENHALLLTAQLNLNDAKARGQDTTAIQQQVNGFKQNEQALTKEAQGRKIVAGDLQKETQLLLLAAQAQLADAKNRGLDSVAIEKQIVDLQKLLNLLQKQPTEMKNATGAMAGFRMAWQDLGATMKNVQNEMSQAYASAIMGALQSGKSLGAALEQATKQVLENLATQALAKSIFYTAQGIADSIWNPAWASMDFAAAAEFAVVAGMAGAVGLAMPGGGSGSGSGAGGPVAGQGGGNVQLGSGSGSQQNQGITHLAGGGIVTHQIMVGDSDSGGDANEAVVPLENPSALDAISAAFMPSLARALAAPANQDRTYPTIPTSLLAPSTMSAAASAMMSPSAAGPAPTFPEASPSDTDDRMEKFADHLESRLSSSGSGDVHIHMPNLKGVVSPESIKKVFKQAGRMVQNRQLTINATNSLRVTRRSQ